MTLTITHSHVATAADDPSAEINKEEWNDAHVLTGDYLRKATVTLSSADILALHTTPVTLVAAPGSGKWLLAHTIAYVTTPVTTPYATNDSTTAQVGYAAASDGFVNSAPISGVSTRKVVVHHPAPDVDVMDDAEGSALVLKGQVGTTFADGDGTLTVTVWYSVEDVPA